MKSKILPIFSLVISFLFFSQNAEALCTYEMSGSVLTTVFYEEMIDINDVPLKGIKVRVQGKTPGGVWSMPWNLDGQNYVRTNSEGEFTISKDKTCVNRKVRIQIQFDHSELMIKDSTGQARWYTVIETENSDQRDFDFDDRSFHHMRFRDFSYVDEDSEFNLRRIDLHGMAVLWHLNKTAIDHFDLFSEQVTIQYDVGEETGPNYYNHLTDTIHIRLHPYMFPISPVHELGHVYFRRSIFNQDDPCPEVNSSEVIDPATNCPQQAFNEGFADYFAAHVFLEVFDIDDGVRSPTEPAPGLLREFIPEEGYRYAYSAEKVSLYHTYPGIYLSSPSISPIDSYEDVVRSRFGVFNAFMMITLPNIFNVRFTGACGAPNPMCWKYDEFNRREQNLLNCPASPHVSFERVLEKIQGWNYQYVGGSFDDFMADIFGIDVHSYNMYRDLLDPQKEAETIDYCDGTLFQKKPVHHIRIDKTEKTKRREARQQAREKRIKEKAKSRFERIKDNPQKLEKVKQRFQKKSEKMKSKKANEGLIQFFKKLFNFK